MIDVALTPPAPSTPAVTKPIRVDDIPLALNKRVSILLSDGMQLVGTLIGMTPDPQIPVVNNFGGLGLAPQPVRSLYCFDLLKLRSVEILGPGGCVMESHPGDFTFINRSANTLYQIPEPPPAPTSIVISPDAHGESSHDAMDPTVFAPVVARVANYVAVLTADADFETEEGLVDDVGGPVPAYGGPPTLPAQGDSPVAEEVLVTDAAPPQPMGRDWDGWDAGVSKLQALLGDNVDAARSTTLQEAEQESNDEASKVQAEKHRLMLNTIRCLPNAEMLGSLAELGMAPPLFGYEQCLDQLQGVCGGDQQLCDTIEGLVSLLRSKARDAVTVRRFSYDMGGV